MMGNLQEHLLSAEEEQQLRATYREKNYAIINANRPENAPDTLECTFDMDLLQDYLDYVKSNPKTQGISKVRITVCFGQYPDSDFSDRLNPDYKGHQTVYLRADDGTNGACTPIDGLAALDYSNICPPNF